MLVHHADAQIVSIIGVVNLNNLAVLLDDTLFCLIQTKQNAHQSRLTGAILAQQRMDLSTL